MNNKEKNEFLEKLKNMSNVEAYKAAKQAGFRCRTARIDGRSNIKVQDIDMGRVNLEIVGGLVKEAYYG